MTTTSGKQPIHIFCVSGASKKRNGYRNICNNKSNVAVLLLRQLKADKIFISAIPSVETVNFYFNIGCKDALEIIPEYVDTQQDRYMEFLL